MSSALMSMPRLAQAPRLEGPTKRSHYRRSTTTRAPRKRTFLASMQKRSADSLSRPEGPIAASVNRASNLVAFYSCQRISPAGGVVAEATTGGNGGNGASGMPPKRFGGDGNGNGEGPNMPQPAVFGAAAILFAAALLVAPDASSAAMLPKAAVRKAPKSVQMRGSTMIIPNAAAMPVVTSNSIIYGVTGITADERRTIAWDQMRFREAVLVK